MNFIHHSSTNISPIRDQRAWNGRMGQVNSLLMHSCSVRLLIEIRNVQRSVGTRVTGSRNDITDGGLLLEDVWGLSGGRTWSGVPGWSVVASLGCVWGCWGSEVRSDPAGSWVSDVEVGAPSELFESGPEFCWSLNKSSASKCKRSQQTNYWVNYWVKDECIAIVCYTKHGKSLIF